MHNILSKSIFVFQQKIKKIMIFTSICAQFFENFFTCNYGKGYDDIRWAESNPSWTKPFVQCTWSLCFDSLKKNIDISHK